MSSISSAAAVRVRSGLLSGVAAGVVGAGIMGVFAMTAGATYQGTGFFTPLYHIASSLISPDAMMASAARAEAGDLFYLDVGPALLGLSLHLAVGAAFGALFPLVGRALGARGGLWVPLGILYGGAVLALMSFVGLPVAAAIFGGGEPIRSMPAMVGWWTFTSEHLLFGAVLGVWFARRDRVATR